MNVVLASFGKGNLDLPRQTVGHIIKGARKMSLRRIIIGSFAIASIGGCGEASKDSSRFVVRDSAGVQLITNRPASGEDLSNELHLVEELRIGVVEGDLHLQFGRIVSIDTDAEGRIYVLDASANEVRVFDSDGTFVHSIGRSGQGPGEFRFPSTMLLDDGEIMVFQSGRPVQRFTLDGEVLGSFPLAAMPTRPNWVVLPDGDLLAQHRGPTTMLSNGYPSLNDVLMRVNRTGEALDTLFALPPIEMRRLEDGTFVPQPFGSEPVWTLIENEVLIANSTETRIEAWSFDGALQRVIDVGLDPIPFGTELRERMANLLGAGSGMSSDVFPENLPMIQGLFPGPHRTIWIQGYRVTLENADRPFVPQWYVANADGELLGPLLAPDFTPLHSRSDKVYGIGVDEHGVQYVIRARIEGL